MSQAPPPLGTPVVRREGRDKVTGIARYAAEHTPPGCLYGRPVPATIVRGRVDTIHADEILALPGVRAVLTHENAPGSRSPTTRSSPSSRTTWSRTGAGPSRSWWPTPRRPPAPEPRRCGSPTRPAGTTSC